METQHAEAAAPTGPPPVPSLPVRVGQVLVSPGRLFEALREHPRSAGALVLGAIIVTASTALIPGEIWAEMARAQALEAGREMPADFDLSGVFRIGALVAGLVFWFVWAFLLAGVTTLVFAFVLGDDGRFRQYLAVTAHAMVVPALGALLVTPLKIAERDPQLTLNLGLFLPFMEDGYWATVLGMLDIFVLWSYVLVALGVHVIDRRRPWGGAAGLLLALGVLLTMGVAAIIPT